MFHKPHVPATLTRVVLSEGASNPVEHSVQKILSGCGACNHWGFRAHKVPPFMELT